MLTQNHELLNAEVKRHIEAGAVMANNHYWNEDDFTGCFIGCLTHSADAQRVTDLFGLPLPLVSICENVFEALPDNEGRAFFAAIPRAVGRDGKNLSRVHWHFLAAELRALPAQSSHIQDVIDPVIKGMDLLAGGAEWCAAADAAARAARAEGVDVRIRQRDTILRLISEAK